MMKIGSTEWFEKLSTMAKFPSYFSFYLLKKGDELSIAVKAVESKAKDKSGIKYGALEPTLGMIFSTSNIAVLDVCLISNVESYYEKVKKLSNQWGVELIDEK